MSALSTFTKRSLLAASVSGALLIPTAAHADPPGPVFNTIAVHNDCVRLGWHDPVRHFYSTTYHVIEQVVGDPDFREFDSSSDSSFSTCGLEPRTEYVFKVQSCEIPRWLGKDTCSAWTPATFTTPINWIAGGDFEYDAPTTLISPWLVEGTPAFGIDHNLGYAHGGKNNAYMRTTNAGWNAITHDALVRPHTEYLATVWVRTSANLSQNYLGIRAPSTNQVLQQIRFGPIVGPYQQMQIWFDSGSNDAVRFFVGFWGAGNDAWMQVDDFWLAQFTPIME